MCLYIGLTVIANLAAVDDNAQGRARDVFSNTFTRAPQYNLGMAKTMGIANDTENREQWMMHSYYTDEGYWPTGLTVTRKRSGFLNE